MLGRTGASIFRRHERNLIAGAGRLQIGAMRIAYIVSAYKLPDQLARLVTTLDTETCHFFIHVDRKTDDAIYRRMVTRLAPLANVHFLDRHRCYYGGFGHVRATLKGISEIFRRQLPFDYAILLTGQDYPIKSNHEIDAFLTQHDGRSFLEHFPLPSEEWSFHGLDRIELWHVRLGGKYLRFRQRPGIRIRRRFPSNLHPFGGSAYWCLSRESTEYVHRFLQQNRSYVRFFRYVNVPEEMFFHTIILNSPLSESVVNDDLRYLEWRHPAVAGGPAVLTKDDFGKIVRSPKLFARKFDMTQDSEVLDMIDATICGY
jgi:hypothetical protein